MLKYRWDQVTVEEERGIWQDQGHAIDFGYGQYHPDYFNVTFEVYAEFVFQGSGLLMCNQNARRLLYDGTNLIIDR